MGQDGQTVGIPVGPDSSRIISEIIGVGMDKAYAEKTGDIQCTTIRHVDDVWIGTNTHEHAENCLWKYREAAREYELDINESKTHIWSDDFRFCDEWPSEIPSKFDYALQSPDRYEIGRLRNALEHAFSHAVEKKDDGVLKYVIRYIDRHGLHSSHWGTVEPFLKRTAIHFGHTIDYIARVLVWRNITQGDVDKEVWNEILLNILGRHAKLGNDSEICWTLFTCSCLDIIVPGDLSKNIARNCGSLSAVTLANLAETGTVDVQVWDDLKDIVSSENCDGKYWPLFVEWKSKRWQNHGNVRCAGLLDILSTAGVTLYETQARIPVFQDVEEDRFGEIHQAIERRVSYYDDEAIEDDNLAGFKDDEEADF